MTVNSLDLVITLHGYGADGRQAEAFANGVAMLRPGLRFASPDAPSVCETGIGLQWFGLRNLDERSLDARLLQARQAFDRIMERTLAAYGLTGSLDRVVLAGFSQGAVMALDAVATGRWPVAAVISFAGRLVTPDPLTPRKGTRALLLHGEADDVIVPGYTIEAAERLAACGVRTEHHIMPTVGHTIVPQMLMIASRFLTH